MLNLGGERTLIGAVVPPRTGHVSTMISVTFSDLRKMLMYAGLTASLPYDAFVKILGKGDMYLYTIIRFPFFAESDCQIIVRALMLNALTDSYKALWETEWNDDFLMDQWAKKDERLSEDTYSKLTRQWNAINFPRSDYARRQMMVELDVLVARKLGLSLDELKVIYRIQFPIMRQYESDTWYDANGRISFTTNRSLIGVGFSRTEWENGIKGAPSGQKFYRTITDDTMPSGPVERTIEYVAPFDRCDREQDYETAWKFFEEKYGNR